LTEHFGLVIINHRLRRPTIKVVSLLGKLKLIARQRHQTVSLKCRV